MAIPIFSNFYIPILENLSQNESKQLKELSTYIIEKFQFTSEDLDQKVGKESLINNRIRWALLYLKKAGLIKNIDRGIYQITEKGINFFEENPHFNNRNLDIERELSNSNESDIVEVEYDTYSENLANEILDKLKNMGTNTVDKGVKFEKLCLKLLEKMGYGTSEHTGGSGDHGIDGIMYEDKLQLYKIGVQCKCQQKSISSKEISHFKTGLEQENIDKGIFITTSDFTKDAKETLNKTNNNIILIKGEKLVSLMIEYEVGVEMIGIKKIYKIILEDN